MAENTSNTDFLEENTKNIHDSLKKDPKEQQVGKMYYFDDGKVDIISLDYSALQNFILGLGEKKFRCQQIFRWIHQRSATSFADMTDLSKKLRGKLEQKADFRSPLITDVKISSDGTRKFQLTTHDNHIIEAVYIPQASAEDRNALCISSQVGCAMACRFCATAKLKLARNLSPGEIIGQYHAVNRHLEDHGIVKRLGKGANRVITNIVYMGMGEPLHNYQGVISSIHLFRDENGPNMAGRRITVSTSGLVSSIKRLGEDSDVHIAISLNASTDEVRSQIMPVNRKWKIADLLQACHEFPIEKRRRITFEYVLLKGINDSDDDARRVVELLKDFKSKINLIPFNAHPLSDYEKPSNNRVHQFQTILREAHLSAFIRGTRGDDIDAACGMLGAKKLVAARKEETLVQLGNL